MNALASVSNEEHDLASVTKTSCLTALGSQNLKWHTQNKSQAYHARVLVNIISVSFVAIHGG